MPTLKRSHILIPALMLLSACGGGSGGCAPSDGRSLDTSTSTVDTCSNTGAPASIAIAYPKTSTISHLTDITGTNTAIYSYAGTVFVSDKAGNAVADGTLVRLDVIDTVLATGTINSGIGDGISASTFLDTDPTLSGGIVAAGDISAANVDVDGAAIGLIDTATDIKSLVIITTGADKRDQVREVSSVTGNTITVTSQYNDTYPNTTYLTNTSSYVAGKTTIGMDILGIDPDDASARLVGYSKTVNGKATFRMEYPATGRTLRVGCNDSVLGPIPAIDTRYTALNSRDVWVVAQVDGYPSLTVVDDQACFFHILPETFSANTTAVNTASTVTLTLTDSENVTLPFYTVLAVPSAAGATGTTCLTNSVGKCDVTVTGASADTLTYNTPNAGGTAVTITIN